MVEYNLVQMLTIITGLICFFLSLYPFLKLITYHSKTKVLDYLIFSLMFLLGGFTVFIISALFISTERIIYQISEWSIDIAYFLMLLHAVRINSSERKKAVIMTIGIIWLLVLIIFSLMWVNIPKNHSYTYLFNLPGITSIYELYPINYGTVINGTIILSVDFRFFANLFHFCISLFTYLEYRAISLVHLQKSEKVRKGLSNYKLALSFILISRLFLFPLAEIEFVFISFLLLIPGFYYMLKIMLFYPETMLVSQIQITRVIQMYDRIPLIEELEGSKDHTLLELKEYMDSIKDIKFELSSNQ